MTIADILRKEGNAIKTARDISDITIMIEN